MAVRAITHAIRATQEIAKNPDIPAEQKAELSQKVLDAGTAATIQPAWDNWAQRLVAGGLTLIGIVLGVFVGIAVLQGDQHINAAYTAALTAVVGGLAGMFTQKALSSGGDSNSPTGSGGDGVPRVGVDPNAKAGGDLTAPKADQRSGPLPRDGEDGDHVPDTIEDTGVAPAAVFPHTVSPAPKPLKVMEAGGGTSTP